MSSFFLFISSFASYLVLLLVIVALCAVAVTIGITLRRKKNQKEVAVESSVGEQ